MGAERRLLNSLLNELFGYIDTGNNKNLQAIRDRNIPTRIDVRRSSAFCVQKIVCHLARRSFRMGTRQPSVTISIVP